jgi:hypothetical protein
VSGLSPEVDHLLRGRESVREVDPVDFQDMLAEPAVKRIRRSAQAGHRRLQVFGLEIDDGEVAAGGLLDPDGLAVIPRRSREA